MTIRCSIVAAALLSGAAQAASVYILSSGNSAVDDSVVAALQARGHTATVGVQFSNFDGTQSLAGYQAVYLQTNVNWTGPDMPAAGQAQLLSYVSAGGGLVTCEWTVWKISSQGQLQSLGASLPVQFTAPYDANATAQFDQITADATLNAGLPPSFTAPLDNFAGTETMLTARTGASVFYRNPLNSSGAAIGWSYGQGRVLCFATTNGSTQLADPNFGRLFANAFTWSAGGSCYANCDGSTTQPILNVLDFTCFLNEFAAGDPRANCDGSTTVPTLNVLDFTCFLNRFAAGCA